MNKVNVDGKLESIASACDTLSGVIAHPVYVLNTETKQLLYVSSYPEFIGGYSTAENVKGTNFFMEVCNPDDKKFLSTVLPLLTGFYKNLHPSKIRNYSASFNCGIITLSGASVMINHKVTPFEISEDNEVKAVLGVLSPAVISRGYDLSVHDNLGLMRWKYDFDGCRWIEDRQLHLSKTERLVLFYTCNGMSIKQIANVMCKSEDTIKGFRRRIFEKFGVKNIQEAIMVALTHNLL